MQIDQHVDVVGHTPDSVEVRLLVFHDAIQIRIEFLFVFFHDGILTVFGPEHYVIYGLCVAHVYLCLACRGAAVGLVPDVSPRRSRPTVTRCSTFQVA